MSSSLVGDILAIALFIIATFGVLCGFPIAFTLAGFSLLFAALGWALGVFDPIFLTSLPSRYFGLMTNEVLVAVPLFIFMGAVLERSKIAEALLETMGQLFGTMRGGLGHLGRDRGRPARRLDRRRRRHGGDDGPAQPAGDDARRL